MRYAPGCIDVRMPSSAIRIPSSRNHHFTREGKTEWKLSQNELDRRFKVSSIDILPMIYD